MDKKIIKVGQKSPKSRPILGFAQNSVLINLPKRPKKMTDKNNRTKKKYLCDHPKLLVKGKPHLAIAQNRVTCNIIGFENFDRRFNDSKIRQSPNDS